MTEIFPIQSPSGRPGAFLILLMLALLLLFAFIGYSARAARFVVDEEGIAIRRALYGRALSWNQVAVEDARIVDLGEEGDLKPTLRTNGIGLPGYRAGWFRLQGGERGLLFVTRSERSVAVPTTEGYTLLVSPADPDAFLASLHRHSR